MVTTDGHWTPLAMTSLQSPCYCRNNGRLWAGYEVLPTLKESLSRNGRNSQMETEKSFRERYHLTHIDVAVVVVDGNIVRID